MMGSIKSRLKNNGIGLRNIQEWLEVSGMPLVWSRLVYSTFSSTKSSYLKCIFSLIPNT